MTPEELSLWRQAGRLTAEARAFGVKQIKKGLPIREVCDAIDQQIIKSGGQPAWPTQISCDACAAHFTPSLDDDTPFDNQLASLDLGVRVDGFVGDTAYTVDLSGKYGDHIAAAHDALQAAMKLVAPGRPVSEIGKAVAEAIESHGLKPIRNLSGHGISRNVIHDRPNIPNYPTGTAVLKEGQVIAIEPFATDGVGMVVDAEPTTIYSLVDKKPIRNPFARPVLEFIDKNYGAFPFTTRWLEVQFGKAKMGIALRELLQNGSIMGHAPLVEKTGGMVAVFEHTLLVQDKPEILTRDRDD